MVRRIVGSLAVVLAITSVAPRAHADEADDLIARGLDMREKGKDDEALALFKKALATTPSPRARAQVALAEQALGTWAPAETDLVAALAAGSDPWIAKNRSALEGALATVRKHLGSIDVRGTDGAEVFLDGVKLGSLPGAAFRVEAGHRTLEVRAKGFQSTTRMVDVPAGGIARETVNLAAASVVEEPKVAKADTIKSPPKETETGDPGHTQRVVGWGFVAGGGVLVAGGIAAVFVRQGIISDYNTQCPGVGAAQQPAGCNDKIDSSSTWKTISIVSLVAGGAFAIGGITLVLTAAKADKSVACAPSLGGVVCGGRF